MKKTNVPNQKPPNPLQTEITKASAASSISSPKKTTATTTTTAAVIPSNFDSKVLLLPGSGSGKSLSIEEKKKIEKKQKVKQQLQSLYEEVFRLISVAVNEDDSKNYSDAVYYYIEAGDGLISCYKCKQAIRKQIGSIRSIQLKIPKSIQTLPSPPHPTPSSSRWKQSENKAAPEKKSSPADIQRGVFKVETEKICAHAEFRNHDRL